MIGFVFVIEFSVCQFVSPQGTSVHIFLFIVYNLDILLRRNSYGDAVLVVSLFFCENDFIEIFLLFLVSVKCIH